MDPVLKPVVVVGVCPNMPKEGIVFGVLNRDADAFCGCCWLAKENPGLNVVDGWAGFWKSDVAVCKDRHRIHHRLGEYFFLLLYLLIWLSKKRRPKRGLWLLL